MISTHPFASQALGRLRSRGRLHVPVVTYLTDLSVHPLWVHRGVDLHLALHEVAARQARSWGGEATVIDPLVPRALPGLLPAPGLAADYRASWGLAPDARIALVVGGSMGIGELASAAADIAATGLAVPVVVCGHNAALVRRLGDTRRCRRARLARRPARAPVRGRLRDPERRRLHLARGDGRRGPRHHLPVPAGPRDEQRRGAPGGRAGARGRAGSTTCGSLLVAALRGSPGCPGSAGADRLW